MAVARIRCCFGRRGFAPHGVRHNLGKQRIDLFFSPLVQVGELRAPEDFGLFDKQFLGHQVGNLAFEHAVENSCGGAVGIGRD